MVYVFFKHEDVGAGRALAKPAFRNLRYKLNRPIRLPTVNTNSPPSLSPSSSWAVSVNPLPNAMSKGCLPSLSFRSHMLDGQLVTSQYPSFPSKMQPLRRAVKSVERSWSPSNLHHCH